MAWIESLYFPGILTHMLPWNHGEAIVSSKRASTLKDLSGEKYLSLFSLTCFYFLFVSLVLFSFPLQETLGGDKRLLRVHYRHNRLQFLVKQEKCKVCSEQNAACKVCNVENATCNVCVFFAPEDCTKTSKVKLSFPFLKHFKAICLYTTIRKMRLDYFHRPTGLPFLIIFGPWKLGML